MVEPSGLKLVGGPHCMPAMNSTSPAAPARPLAVPCWLPVWAVPQPAAPRPTAAPPTASPERARKRRRLVSKLYPLTSSGPNGDSVVPEVSCDSFIVSFPDFFVWSQDDQRSPQGVGDFDVSAVAAAG